MEVKSQTVLVSEIRDLLSQIARRVNDLEGTISATELHFGEREAKVSWNYGVMNFRSDGVSQFDALRALYQARPEALSHAELAFLVFGDELAEIYHVVRKLQIKLEEHRCPLRLSWNKQYIWLEDA